MKQCPICGKETKQYDLNARLIYLECTTCGSRYVPYYMEEITEHKLRSYLLYDRIINDRDVCYVYDDKQLLNALRKAAPTDMFIPVSKEIIEAWYPRTFYDKINKILFALSMISKYEGEQITVDHHKIPGLFFLQNTSDPKIFWSQLKFILDYLINNHFIKSVNFSTNMSPGTKADWKFEILPNGYKEIYDIQKQDNNNKDVFVAMSFDESENSTREAIKQAIVGAEFSATFMDEIIHNRQIVPEMLRLIKECRFLIMDISNPNFGAYFESGFAMGLGKEVIVTCSEKIMSCTEKGLKPHFDLAQKQMIVWKDEADLTKRLTEWIKLLFAKRMPQHC